MYFTHTHTHDENLMRDYENIMLLLLYPWLCDDIVDNKTSTNCIYVLISTVYRFSGLENVDFCIEFVYKRNKMAYIRTN